MTATCLPHAACMQRDSNPPKDGAWSRATQFLAALASRVVQQVQARYTDRRQTQALCTMDATMLRDIGAPHWLKRRAKDQQNLDDYERFKAMSRLKY